MALSRPFAAKAPFNVGGLAKTHRPETELHGMMLISLCYLFRDATHGWLARIRAWLRALATAIRPSCCACHPPQQREQGMPGARCTRGLVCKIVQRGAH